MGTILSTAAESNSAKNVGKVLPSVGLTLVPVKEAVAPNKVQEQNTASQVRATIKRLDYMLTENLLVGDRDPEILPKTKKLRDELKQAQLQLVDLPLVEFDPRYSQEDAEQYFNNPKVNKKYKLKIN
jgi:enterochelin esterase-like enzyme